MAELTDQQLADLQELIAKSRQGAIPPIGDTVPQATTQSPGFTLRLGGNSYSVKDQDEAQRLLDQYEAQRQQELESQRIQAQAQQQQVERAQAQQSAGGRAADDFDKEEYARLFLADPRQAQRYMIQHDPEQIQFYSGLVAKINEVKQESAASQFLLQHRDDYRATPKNFGALNSLITQFNLPWDLNGLNLAYSVAKMQGSLEGGQSAAGGQGRGQQQSEFDDYEAPPPSLKRRRSGTSADSENEEVLSQFENLSSEAQKKYLESLVPQR